jgi:5-methylcytosine-specific restriction endonuclease McrA
MDLRPLSNEELLARTETLAAQERAALADMIEHLAEIDRRDIIRDYGYESLYAYCRAKLGYSEGFAYSRIRAARAVLSFPELLDKLRRGELHLDAIVRLHPVLTHENKDRVLRQAKGATSRRVWEIVADLGGAPPSRPDFIRPLARPPSVEIIPPPRRMRFEFEADDELVVMVEKLKGLLAHKYPFARLEDVFKESAQCLLEKLTPARSPKRTLLRKSKLPQRRIPAAVKRHVWERDGGRCVYVSEDGKQCGNTHALQYDHIVPYALGGASDDPTNIRLLCRSHNLRLGRKRFGPRRRAQSAATSGGSA